MSILTRLRRTVLWVGLVLLVATTASACGAIGSPADEPVPPGVAAAVDVARESLNGEWERIPAVHFRLVDARCRANGGVMYLFEQRETLPGKLRFAFAYTGSRPLPSEPRGFGGGFDVEDPEADAEIRAFFQESPEIPCT